MINVTNALIMVVLDFLFLILDTYNCYNGRCVALSSVCDEVNSCGDFSDEIDCRKSIKYYFVR